MNHISRSLVIAPHPDDEILGPGATLLKRKANGGNTAWLIVTTAGEEIGWGEEKIATRESEISRVAQSMKFDEVYRLNLPASNLESLKFSEIVQKISEIVTTYRPEEVFTPHFSDVHTDHRIVYEATTAAVKWFRNNSVKRLLTYETISETNFSTPLTENFRPNYFSDIAQTLEEKILALKVYESEIGIHPFPRSQEAIRALAILRGSQSGFSAAEAFQLIMERE
jgi:LmbE family N-acetylglucosaminyl deacetylase